MLASASLSVVELLVIVEVVGITRMLVSVTSSVAGVM
ncbi:MAG: hypothetical protein BWY91_00799 [bacterium ADurb.BinA028]|nr:MAG: hypothetical protein BWY91_00799 [bacterium ADurb.BinA028]